MKAAAKAVKQTAAGAFAAAALVSLATPAVAHADDPLVFPGMKIIQGTAACTLGFVDPDSRIGMTAGHCGTGADGPVFDENGNFIGIMAIAHYQELPTGTEIADNYAKDYETVRFTDHVAINNILPNGLQLQKDPSVVPQPGLPVCRMGITTGEVCGNIALATNDWFTVDGPPVQHGDSGSAVYAMTPQGTAAILGIVHGTSRNSAGELQTMAVSWSGITRQLHADLDKYSPPSPPKPAAPAGPDAGVPAPDTQIT